MNREQLRARNAFASVRALTLDKAKFLDIARGLPAMLQTNGILASWAHLEAKGEKAVLEALELHLRTDLANALDKLKDLFDRKGNVQEGRALTGRELRLLTAEATEHAVWIKRAAEALLSGAERRAGG